MDFETIEIKCVMNDVETKYKIFNCGKELIYYVCEGNGHYDMGDEMAEKIIEMFRELANQTRCSE